jgi:hypothetical protein
VNGVQIRNIDSTVLFAYSYLVESCRVYKLLEELLAGLPGGAQQESSLLYFTHSTSTGTVSTLLFSTSTKQTFALIY